jgi:hypothetical protein
MTFIAPPCIILPVVLYVCETLQLILREEHRLRAIENRVLRKIFGLKFKCQILVPKG